MLYAFGFLDLFTIGGLTGLFLATLAIDVPSHTPISSSRISTTSWSGGWCGPVSGGCISGAPRSRAPLSRTLGALRGVHDVLRLQSDVLSAVHSGRSGHAAALPRLSAGIPDAATCSPRPAPSILAAAYLLPFLYLAWSPGLWAKVARQSVERDRPRVANDLAAAHAQLRDHAGRQ